uniref:Uncharacterized protein n=1 Tax=Oncorhynchus kisutch TaxID=8019 RepID=A0A8C7F722_ONCKI
MAQMFTISDSESEPSEEVGETEKDQSSAGKGMTGGPIGHALTVPEMRLAGEGRLRMNSESQAQELQGRGPGVEGMPTDGASFRGRSQSAPPALWAAKRYGRQLRRMSDEFDTWLDKGEMRRVKSAGAAKQMTKSPSWWAYLFSHKETERWRRERIGRRGGWAYLFSHQETTHRNRTTIEPRSSEYREGDVSHANKAP